MLALLLMLSTGAGPAVSDSADQLTQTVWVEPRPVTESLAVAPPPTATGFLTTGGPIDADMPREVAVTPDGSTALIVHRDTNNLVFFDLNLRTTIGVVTVGSSPVDVAITSNGQLAVTANLTSGDVSVVDIATQTRLADIPVTGQQPFAVEITPNNRRAIVGVINDAVTSAFSVISLVSLTEVQTIPTTPQGAIGFFFTPEPGIAGNLFTTFAVAPDGRTIVLPDRGGAQVTIYDRITGTVRATLATAALPSAVAISSDGQIAVVSHEGSAQAVSVIDLATDTLTSTHAIGQELTNRLIRLTPDGTHAICSVLNAVSFVDVTSGAVTATIATGDAGDIELSFDGQYVFVSNFNARVIDVATQSLLQTLPLAPSYEAAVSGSSLRAVALNNRFREDLHVYDISGVAAFVEGREITGPPPEGDATRTLGISGDGFVAVAVHNTSRNAAVIDLVTQSVRSWIETGERSLGVAVAPDGQTAVVCNGDDDTVSILDLTTDTLAVNLSVAQRPAEVVISPDSQTAYVTTVAGTDQLHFIQLAGAASSVLGSIPTGQMGGTFAYAFGANSNMALSEDGSLLGVCISFDDELMLVDTQTRSELARVSVGDFPYRVTFTPSASRAWVINAFGDSVSVVNILGPASSVIATVPGIDTPATVDFAALGAGGFVYVANAATPSVLTVIDGGTHAVVASVPLPMQVREAYISQPSPVLYLAGTDTGGTGRLVRVQIADASTAVIDETPLTGAPSDLVVSPPLELAVTAHPVPDGVDLVRFGPTGSFCDAGDGSLALCPCGNAGTPDTGCDSPIPAMQGGGTTGGVGLGVVAQETSPLNRATLTGTGYPTASAPGTVVIRASSVSSSGPVVFGDGLRCIGLPITRLGATVGLGGTSTRTFGHGTAAGTGAFYYQLWFRSSPASYCDPTAAFNLSNGITLVW